MDTNNNTKTPPNNPNLKQKHQPVQSIKNNNQLPKNKQIYRINFEYEELTETRDGIRSRGIYDRESQQRRCDGVG